MSVIECIFNWDRCGPLLREEIIFWSLIVLGASTAIFLFRHHDSLPFINRWRIPFIWDNNAPLYLVPGGVALLLLLIVL